MPANDFDNLDVLARPVAHLPFVRQVIDDLGLVDVLEEYCPEHALNRVSDAECAMALILNVLCEHPALYRMDEWLGKLDVDMLFGEGIDASAFNDTRLGQALDHLDLAGTDTVLSALALRYLEQNPDNFTLHHDTTSVSLCGAYEQAPVEGAPVPAKGTSKDRKPNLKQLIFGLSLHGTQAVPLVATVMDGNTSDTAAARDHLRRIVELLPDEREVTFVGDSKTVDKQTIGRLLREGLHVIRLVSKTFNVRQDVIDAAFDQGAESGSWPLLAETKPRRKAEPTKQFRGMSFERPLNVVLETANGEPGVAAKEPLRFLVIASDSLREQFDNQLDKVLQREIAALDKMLKSLNAKGFACEADARGLAATLPALAPLHAVTVTLVADEERLKRARAGRSRKDEVPETRTVWRIEVALERDEARIDAARKRAGCFVLVSDWAEEDWSDAELLASGASLRKSSPSERTPAECPSASPSLPGMISSRWMNRSSRRGQGLTVNGKCASGNPGNVTYSEGGSTLGSVPALQGVHRRGTPLADHELRRRIVVDLGGAVRVANRLLVPNDFLHFDTDDDGYVDGFAGYMLARTPIGKRSPSDAANAWTIIVDTANFAGPVMYMASWFWDVRHKWHPDATSWSDPDVRISRVDEGFEGGIGSIEVIDADGVRWLRTGRWALPTDTVAAEQSTLFVGHSKYPDGWADRAIEGLLSGTRQTPNDVRRSASSERIQPACLADRGGLILGQTLKVPAPSAATMAADLATLRDELLGTLGDGAFCPGDDEALREGLRALLPLPGLSDDQRADLEAAIPAIETLAPEDVDQGD